MGFKLDAIIKETLLDNETINVSGNTERIDIDNREAAFSIQITYSNGVGPVDIDFFYELSNTGDEDAFIPVSSESVTITDESGEILFDIADSGASYLRVGYTVNTGSVDAQIIYSAKARH